MLETKHSSFCSFEVFLATNTTDFNSKKITEYYPGKNEKQKREYYEPSRSKAGLEWGRKKN